jgi:hypothetical protein
VFGVVLELIRQRVTREIRRAGVKAAFALVALAFLFLGAAGLLVSLFLALEPSLGALRSALSVSGIALAIALLASTPLWWPKRQPPPPPQDFTLAQWITLVSQSSGGLSLRQLALGGVLVALAIGAAAGTAGKKPPPKP